ncbi:MAG: small-conductance mechanosensitive channel, partial [Myxococcota bacterium]
MNITPYLTALWSGFGEVLLEGTGGESLTLGGLIIVLVWVAIGGLIAAYSSTVVVLYERARGISDEQLLTLSRHAIRFIVFLSCLLIGLDMGGVASVQVSVGKGYETLSSILSVTLFTRSEVPITIGGLVTVAIWLVIGRSLSRHFSALLLRLAREREVDDERILRIIKQISEAVVVLACLGVGLDMGSLASIDRSVSGFFSLFTSEMFVLGNHGITITTLLTVSAIVVGSFYVSRLARATMRPALELRLNTPEDQGTVSVIDRLAHYIIVAIGFIIALQTAGINLSALLATGAAFAVGLSLAMQSMAQNFISGLILLLERAIKPGDILELDGEPVRVIRIGIRSTVVKTLNDEDRIVPNSNLVEN